MYKMGLYSNGVLLNSPKASININMRNRRFKVKLLPSLKHEPMAPFPPEPRHRKYKEYTSTSARIIHYSVKGVDDQCKRWGFSPSTIAQKPQPSITFESIAACPPV